MLTDTSSGRIAYYVVPAREARCRRTVQLYSVAMKNDVVYPTTKDMPMHAGHFSASSVSGGWRHKTTREEGVSVLPV